ncbi:MAG: transposase [Planctomycetaceae bacterium]|nr:transposase [Planctomycetaceae bacterium]
MKTEPRGRRCNVKEPIVLERGYRNYVLDHEDVAEIDYRPTKCNRSYRLVILRKTILVKKGQKLLFPEIRYFFYLTNVRTMTLSEVVFDANKRCNQENLIGQLKSGMKALRMPLNTLESNWVYLLCGCLAWTLKSWSALLSVTDPNNRDEVECKNRLLRMEFATFLQAMVMIPAQVIRSGRQIILRFLNMNSWTTTFFRLYESLRRRRILRE